MTDHTCTEKIGGDSIYFCSHRSRAENRYDIRLFPRRGNSKSFIFCKTSIKDRSLRSRSNKDWSPSILGSILGHPEAKKQLDFPTKTSSVPPKLGIKILSFYVSLFILISACIYVLIMQICVDLVSYTCEIMIVGKWNHKKLGPILIFVVSNWD